ncbi:hypothetical protein [Agaribacterium sp. ZY112]|uniref:hypothetical protein n=1 Tax=Agaribacterium sp. ZY112 TaxID=3233574 RepID=UPI003524B26F
MLSVSQFKELNIPTTCTKFKNAKTMWVNSEAILSLPPEYHHLKNSDAFCDTFAYGISGTECFEGLEFDINDTLTVQAERYGGAGTLAHGGGVRTGTFDRFQLKGIGSNILEGKMLRLHHSYGGADLKTSLQEVISTLVLDEILPLGTVAIYGIIHVSAEAGYHVAHNPETYGPDDYYLKRGDGIILVREAFIRPAHFIQCPIFQPISKQIRAKSDTGRTRIANKRLNELLGGKNGYIQFMGKYLSASANQLAFAKIYGIAHNALSPSNISLDGRWVDTWETNYGVGRLYKSDLNPSLNFEQERIIAQVQECVLSFAKFNRIELNPDVLSKYYIEQSQAYFEYYIPFLLGLDGVDLSDPKIKSCIEVLSKKISSDVCSLAMGLESYSDRYQNSLLVIFLSELFSSAVALYEEGGERVSVETSACLELWKQAAKEAGVSQENVLHFAMSKIIVSMRRAYFVRIFNMDSYVYSNSDESLKEYVYKQCDSDDKFNCVPRFIEGVRESIKWIMATPVDSAVVLFETCSIKVTFDYSDSKYTFVDQYLNKTFLFSSFDELKGFLHSRHKDLILYGHDFTGYLEVLDRLLVSEELECLV